MEDTPVSLNLTPWRIASGMPSHSRAFDLQPFHDVGDAPRPEESFFIPSYLQGSAYVQKLENAHKLKALLQREAKLRAAENVGTVNKAAAAATGGLAKGTLPSGSHRGMSHAVIERGGANSNEDLQQLLPPLPARWNKEDVWEGLEVHENGLTLKFTGLKNSGDRNLDAAAVRADHFMPPQCGIYYYEVHIMHGRKDDVTIGIGFATKSVELSRPIGWEPESWALHGDDGRVFTASKNGRVFSNGFNPGDVIGCGVNFRDHTAFYTKNGVHLGTAFDRINLEERLFPCISLKKSNEQVRANFGQSPFVYNINDMMKVQKERVQADIAAADTSKLADMDENELIQSLVLQCLQHDGYIETARAFAEEMGQQKNALRNPSDIEVDGIDIHDDEHAVHRQRIRKAILDGDINEALQITNTHYPMVLRENEEVKFKLQCRQFVELVRKTAEVNTSLAISREKKQRPPDVDEAAYSHQDERLVELEQAMLQYGQDLQVQYANHPSKKFQTALRDIWGLLAYRNPIKEPEVSYLLDKKGRQPVSEELNSAILSSLGKSSRAALETIYAQTSIVLEDLQREGGDGAFISVKDLIDKIPIAEEL